MFDFNFGCKIPNQYNSFENGDQAPKLVLNERTSFFKCPEEMNLQIVEESDCSASEEEQITQLKADDDGFELPIRERSSSIGAFIFENKEALT